jgi:hypothetical protein
MIWMASLWLEHDENSEPGRSFSYLLQRVLEESVRFSRDRLQACPKRYRHIVRTKVQKKSRDNVL